MPKFTFEEHEKRMRQILNPKPQPSGERPEALRKLMELAKAKRQTELSEIEPEI